MTAWSALAALRHATFRRKPARPGYGLGKMSIYNQPRFRLSVDMNRTLDIGIGRG